MDIRIQDLLKKIHDKEISLLSLDSVQLVAILQNLNELYRAGTPFLPDHEYDQIYLTLKNIDPGNNFFEEVEDEIEETFSSKRIEHSKLMLSIDKAYSFEEIKKYLIRVAKHADNLTKNTYVFKATAKLDGMAGSYENNKLITRGDGQFGFDITNIFNQGVLALGGKNTGAGEIVLKQKYFDQYLVDKFSHPRNVIVGIAGSDEINIEARKALDSSSVLFIPHSKLEGWTGTAEELLSDFYLIMERVKISPYPTDGVVIEVLDQGIKESMGSTNHHHNWQIAYKELGEIATCEVQSISWQLGRTGKCTPVLNVSETALSGAKIKRVTAHNGGMIKKLGIGKGALIEIIRSGEVIPKIVRVIKKAKRVKIIRSCPSCNQELIWKNDFLICSNYNQCSSQILSKLIHFFNTLGNIDFFGPKTVEKIFIGGFKTLEKIYSMSLEDLENLGLGPKQSTNALEQLNRSRQEQIDDWRFLAAFGIQHLGIGESKKLLKEIRLKDIDNLSQENLMNIEGFGPISSPIIIAEIQKLWPTIKFLMNKGFSLRISGTEVISRSSSVSNLHIIFTGTMKNTRLSMEEEAKNLGAYVQNSVNKKTDFLVIGKNVGDAKIKKAEALNIKIISEEEYIQLIS